MKPTHHSLSPARVPRGLTIVECVVAVLVVGITLAASVNLVGSARKGERRNSDAQRALTLAQDLLAEICAQPYRGSDDVAPAPGRNSAESAAGNRSLFDDVNDYRPWTESPPLDKSGASLGYDSSWTRAVAVEFVEPTNTNTASATDKGIARVIVTVSRNGVVLATLPTLRSLGLPATQSCALTNGTCENLVPAHCLALGGTPGGAGTNCWTTAEVEDTPTTPTYKGKLFYSKNSPAEVQYSEFDPNAKTWANATTSGSATTPVWVAASELNNSSLVLASTSGNALSASVTGTTGTGTYSSICTNVGTATCRPFDASVEGITRRGLMAYYDKSALVARARTTTGTTISSATNIGIPIGVAPYNTTADINWIQLVSLGSGNNQAMVFTTHTNAHVWAARWTGSAWTDHTNMTTTLGDVTREGVCAALESTSGRLMAVFSSSTADQIAYRIYTPGSGWSPLTTLTGYTGDNAWVRITNVPGTNTMFLAASTGSGLTLRVARWNGSSWSSPVTIEPNTGGNGCRIFDITSSFDGSKVMVCYTRANSPMYYRTWTGSAWSSEATGFSLSSGSRRTMIARPGPSGASIVGALGDTNGGVTAWSWDGSTIGPTKRFGTTSTSYGMYQWFAIPGGKP